MKILISGLSDLGQFGCFECGWVDYCTVIGMGGEDILGVSLQEVIYSFQEIQNIQRKNLHERRTLPLSSAYRNTMATIMHINKVLSLRRVSNNDHHFVRHIPRACNGFIPSLSASVLSVDCRRCAGNI